MEIIIHKLLKSALCHNNRNMNTFILRAGLDLNVDASAVLLAYDVDVPQVHSVEHAERHYPAARHDGDRIEVMSLYGLNHGRRVSLCEG